MSKELDDIDLTSEAVRDFIGRPPNGLMRWGTWAVYAVMLIALILSWLVRYPTIVRTELRLISDNLPKPIIPRTDGHIERLFVREGQEAEEGQVVGVIESPTHYQEVMRLSNVLVELEKEVEKNGFAGLKNVSLGHFERLGDVQEAFQRFQQSCLQVKMLHEKGFFHKKRQFFVQEINRSDELDRHLNEQVQIYHKDIELADRELAISRRLHAERVIADLDLFREESKTLAKKLPLEAAEAARINNVTQKSIRQSELIEFEKLASEQEESFFQHLSMLKNSISGWRAKCLLVAPVNGIVQVSGILQEKQFVRAGQELLFIDSGDGQWLGEIRIPQSNFGKVQEGQSVLVKFAGFPFEEFGAIEGEITSIAKISSGEDGLFYATVSMPKGLVTNFGRTLTYKTGMTATAEIITEDLRLIERLFYQLRKLLIRY